MEGFKFRERRENIEKIYDELNGFVENKSTDLASETLKTTEKMIDELSEEDLTEIQQRSTLNMKIRVEHLAKSVYKLESKNKG